MKSVPTEREIKNGNASFPWRGRLEVMGLLCCQTLFCTAPTWSPASISVFKNGMINASTSQWLPEYSGKSQVVSTSTLLAHLRGSTVMRSHRSACGYHTCMKIRGEKCFMSCLFLNCVFLKGNGPLWHKQVDPLRVPWESRKKITLIALVSGHFKVRMRVA